MTRVRPACLRKAQVEPLKCRVPTTLGQGIRATNLAAISFSLTPPMGSTRPLNVSSPVMAVSGLTQLHMDRKTRGHADSDDRSAPITCRPDRRLTRTQASVMPAEGPSLGIAPECIGT